MAPASMDRKEAREAMEASMGAVKLEVYQPNYLDRPESDPEQSMKRAREAVKADRERRVQFLIAARGRKRASQRAQREKSRSANA